MLELLKKEVRTVDGLGNVILPGRVGFEKNGLVKLNPSYYPLFTPETLCSGRCLLEKSV